MELYHGRRAGLLENEYLRVLVLEGGGHIAAIIDKESGINPLWVPPWPSVEPSAFDATHEAVYGPAPDGPLLAGIMGHNLCLDIFGGPSDEEAAAGMTAHGDASVIPYDITESSDRLAMRALLPLAQLRFERQIELHERAVSVREIIRSLCAFDRPIGWTQHVTLGPPFLERGRTEFRASATRSLSFETDFGVADYLVRGAMFEWPHAPRRDGGAADLRVFTSAQRSSAYTAHLMGTEGRAFFVAFSPASKLAFSYVWNASDFPWMGIWEENCSRLAPPWNGVTLTRGMEFGVSPFPETRRAMVDRGRLFETATCRWLPAHGTLEATYWIVVQSAATIPESVEAPE
jgi:hypothetical protein